MTAGGIVRLSDGDLHTEVWPENGGRVTAFYSTRQGRRFDWMVPAPACDIADGRSGAWGSFPLVPFSNRIRDACFEWEGETIRIEATEKGATNAIHGHGRSLPWTVERTTGESVRLCYRYGDGDWPFAYRAVQEISLASGALTLVLELTNESGRSMPAGLGHHPYFPWRGGPEVRARFEQYWPAVEGVLPTGAASLPAELRFEKDVSLPRGLDTGFSGWDGSFRIVWRREDAALEISASGELGHMILFSPPDRPFFCAEPVSHSIDAVNLAARGVGGTGIRSLAPGESMTASVRLVPLLPGE
ncbi:MAG: aldose 1-epimerase [Nisaea sp.]|uniref:aldose 1-epimerase n=1 Tax=Nisaea sp. TaxID=2024842 RepID=UPI001B2DCF19|nr:aldose 1-epimerase [Nisaea sp.]MBO6562641.1 aldose 1-epimerase [Nisaea sp.]